MQLLAEEAVTLDMLDVGVSVPGRRMHRGGGAMLDMASGKGT